jgi:hypothetical protein
VTRYKELGFEHLNNVSTYRPITHITARTVETRVNATWKDICDRRGLSFRVRKSYVTNNSSLPRFYHLIKTHKSLIQLKIRPIVSSSNGPTEKLSWLLSRVLRPVLHTVSAHLESSAELLDILSNLDPTVYEQYHYPFSLDVTALYTSIPVQDAIDNIINVLSRNNFHFFGLTIADINDLLKVVLTNTYFQFYGKNFQQIQGLAMGSNVSPILAIVFMDTIERQTIINSPYIGIYKRYVDDTLCLGRNRQSADEFKSQMNSVHPSIKFEIEHPVDGSNLALLDFKVTINENLPPTFEFYQKEAKKDIFINYKSGLPSLLKTNVIKNERHRINQRCSTNENKMKHNKRLDLVLLKNGYPQHFINNTYGMNPRRNTENTNVKYFYR